MSSIDLRIQEEKLLLELLALGDQYGQLLLIVLALIAEEHVGLDEVVALLL